MAKVVSKTVYHDAQQYYRGWCTTCEDFTRDQVEPDGHGYHCPRCEGDTVMGAEDALLTGAITFNEGGESDE